MSYLTDAARWRALSVRDPNANGHFIYCVRSTRIYCRPTCPGRLARRANVGFYTTTFEAEAAGFRACKRCKPNTVLEDPQERAVEKACLLIDEALKDDVWKSLRLQDLAKKVNLTPRYFHKIFKDKTGLSPKEYAKKRSAECSSPSGTESSTTDPSVQSWDWETFDFNDLIDFESDSSPAMAQDLSMPQDQYYAEAPAADLDMDNLPQPWCERYDFEDFQSGLFFLDDSLVEPYQAKSAPMELGRDKTVPNVSTFELDAAALFSCDNLTELLQR
ncbi:hypothetical protein BDW02DRAFT_530001 [Decorospora gaudefroyi]|uniref:HTH araC/xylS-type domain-containing protein n=1 Tax=Decorospora gaudefroyi TaxID=184978 RepID=A0A6A5K3V8_9PLEO|nr:hypothetical protein BDW02DRAFT_530001 [Decorospora gaudefroyi]